MSSADSNSSRTLSSRNGMPPSDGEPRSLRQANLPRIVIGSMLLGLVIWMFWEKWKLTSNVNVNWDEYNFLQKVYAYRAGELTRRLQTFHVHFFSWLPSVSASELKQITVARQSFLCLSMLTSACIFAVAKKLTSWTPALFAVFCGQSASLVLQHGASFRYDPFVCFFFVASMALLVLGRTKKGTAYVAGLLVALSLIISLKSAFFIPSIGLFLAARVAWGEDRRQAITNLLQFSFGLVAAFVLLYAFHAMSLAPLAPAGKDQIELASTAQRMLWPDTVMPRRAYFFQTLKADPWIWAFLALGTATALGDIVRRNGQNRLPAITMLAFGLPIFSLLFYRNAFPYFYGMIMPPGCMAIALWVDRIDRPLLQKPFGWRPLLGGVLILSLIFPVQRSMQEWINSNGSDRNGVQRQLLSVIHRLFPEPVPYLDRCGMVSAFPRAGPFITTFNVKQLRTKELPFMRDLIAEKQPVFLIDNVIAFALGGRFKKNHGQSFQKRDFDYMKSAYIHHWGPLWVAGKNISVETRNVPIPFDMPVGATYTLESIKPVSIDGVLVRPGEAVGLSPGRHELSAKARGSVTLRYGTRLPIPDVAALSGPVFEPF